MAAVLTGGSALAQDAMFVDSSGNVGVGTNTPSAAFNLKRSDGSAQVLVEDTQVAPSQVMFQLKDAGGPRFRMENTDAGYSWNFNAFQSGFSIGLTGTGGSELTLGPDGSLIVGPGGTNNFQVQADGTVRVKGVVVHSSSRTTKRDITPVDDQVVLTKLANLDVAEWAYKDAAGYRHMSPMAEDFYAAFGLGVDNKTVSSSDLAGVALAAAKALKMENAQLKADARADDEEIKALKARMERLEDLVLNGR